MRPLVAFRSARVSVFCLRPAPPAAHLGDFAMLTIFGSKKYDGFCDGMPRRDFLSIGGMMLGSLALPQVLKAEATEQRGRGHKAIINIYLPGGPPHLDMWDLKPDAPAEIRGEYK